MDPDLAEQLRLYLELRTAPAMLSPEETETLLRLAPRYRVYHGVLYYQPNDKARPLQVVERAQALQTLALAHQFAGHRGIDGTIERIRQSHYWPSLVDDVRAYVRACPACQRFLPTVKIEPLHPIPLHSPFHTISIDTIGPLPDSNGARYIVVAVDHFTKWCEARALWNKTADTVATFVYEDIICRHGCPRRIISDNGTEFNNRVMRNITNRMDVQLHHTIVYRPQSNGHVERLNRTLLNALKRTVVEVDDANDDYRREWRDYVPSVVVAYNTMRQRTIGQTPFYLLYGREARLPVQLYTDPQELDRNEEDFTTGLIRRATQLQQHRERDVHLAELVSKRQTKYAEAYNRRLRPVPTHEVIKEGDLVLRRRSELSGQSENKLRAKWKGPYRVVQMESNGAVRLADLSGQPLPKPRHRDQLVRYVEPRQ